MTGQIEGWQLEALMQIIATHLLNMGNPAFTTKDAADSEGNAAEMVEKFRYMADLMTQEERDAYLAKVGGTDPALQAHVKVPNPNIRFVQVIGTFDDSGKLYQEIHQSDIGKAIVTIFGKPRLVSEFMGRILSGDVGKRMYLRSGVIEVENDDQRAARLAGVK